MRMILLVGITFVPTIQVFALPQMAKESKQACSEIAAVRHLPFHPDEKVDDAAYNELRAKGWSIVPCLIGEMTNSHITPDPRSTPIYPKVRVGDVAFWVVRDITGLPYDEMFPAAVDGRFKKEGVYAYFDWVNRDGNRKKLQQNVQRWYASHLYPPK